MKTNNHFTVLIFALSIIIFGLVSCEKDSPETNNKKNHNPFVGNWKGKHAMQLALINVNINLDITFNIDSTFSFKASADVPTGIDNTNNKQEGKGKYSYTESTLTVTPNKQLDFMTDNEFDYKFSGENSSLEISTKDGDTKITLHKK